MVFRCSDTPADVLMSCRGILSLVVLCIRGAVGEGFPNDDTELTPKKKKIMILRL